MEDKVMARNRFSAEQIVNKLREADVLLSQGRRPVQKLERPAIAGSQTGCVHDLMDAKDSILG